MTKKMITFLGRVIVIALISVAVINLPVLGVTTFENCVTTDKGYMWVVNLLAAGIVTYTWGRIYKGAKTIEIFGGIGIFMLMILVVEMAIWHPSQFAQMMAEQFSIRDLKFFGFGILVAVISYAWEVFLPSRKKRPKSVPTSTPED